MSTIDAQISLIIPALACIHSTNHSSFHVISEHMGQHGQRFICLRVLHRVIWHGIQLFFIHLSSSSNWAFLGTLALNSAFSLLISGSFPLYKIWLGQEVSGGPDWCQQSPPPGRRVRVSHAWNISENHHQFFRDLILGVNHPHRLSRSYLSGVNHPIESVYP
jgi:hypothetical protein